MEGMIRRKRTVLFRELSQKSFPVRIQIEITRKCNLRCVHCVLDPGAVPAGELEPADYRRLLPQMREAGVFTLNLTGGELFTHPRIDEILGIILDSDFYVTLQTNGVLLKERHVKTLVSAGPKVRCVALSLYGAAPATHDAVTRSRGSHAKTLRTVRRLADAGINTEVSTLLMTLNHHEFGEIRNLCADLGVGHQFYSLIIPREGGDPGPLEYRMSEEMLRKLPRPWETFAADIGELDPADFTPEKSLDQWCTMGRTNGFITSVGNVLPCSIVNMTAGNVREKSFAEIWRESDVMSKLRSLKIGDFACSECGHFPKCRPCPGLGLYEHGDIFAAPAEVCRIAKIFLGEGGKVREGKRQKAG